LSSSAGRLVWQTRQFPFSSELEYRLSKEVIKDGFELTSCITPRVSTNPTKTAINVFLIISSRILFFRGVLYLCILRKKEVMHQSVPPLLRILLFHNSSRYRDPCLRREVPGNAQPSGIVLDGTGPVARLTAYPDVISPKGFESSP